MSKPNDHTQFLDLFREWRASRAETRRSLLNQDLIDHFGPADASGHVVMPLCEMLPGDLGHVLSLQGDPEVRQHLQEMGFTLGTPVVFVRTAPLRDPITVRVRGYQLSLRRREAEAILMRRCPPDFDDGGRGA